MKDIKKREKERKIFLINERKKKWKILRKERQTKKEKRSKTLSWRQTENMKDIQIREKDVLVERKKERERESERKKERKKKVRLFQIFI